MYVLDLYAKMHTETKQNKRIEKIEEYLKYVFSFKF